MSKAVLRISPGPFMKSGPLDPLALTALALAPWLILLVFRGYFWPLLTPLAALIHLALTKPRPQQRRPQQRRPFAEIGLFSLLATLLIGPAAGPLPYLVSGLALSIIKTKSGLFRHAFLPAAFLGLLTDLALNQAPILSQFRFLNSPAFPSFFHFQSLAPNGPVPMTGPVTGTVTGPVTGLWLLALVPGALAALLSGRQKLINSLIPLLAWTVSAIVLIALKLTSLNWSWGLIWLTLAFHLGREFYPTKSGLAGALIVTLAGLAPLFSPWALPIALALLSIFEIALSLMAQRRAKKIRDPSPDPPPQNPDLVAIRLCARPEPSEIAIYQGPPVCRLAAALDFGPQECPEGCLTLGDCVSGCPHGAIKASGQGLIPKLDKNRCRGCGACLSICPKNLFVLRPREASFVVTCQGSAKLKDMDRLCPAGCLKCGRCRKACPAGAIERLGQLAPPQVSDIVCQKARPDCGLACRSACPRSLPGPAMGLFNV